MNGVVSNQESSIIDRKPIITCAGELEVFSGLEDNLLVALPQDPSEWKRSQGRPTRLVHIGVKFMPFSPAALPRENQWDLIRHPLFHIYWTECTDVEVYKNTIREDIDVWLKELNARNINDWLVVVVENYDSKRTNKLLPRTTVLDKIRTEFAPKQVDRCISVLSPNRHETRTADSWRGLVARVRYLVLVAYARAFVKLEDYVRQQRERRNEPGWHFIKFFQLQEELAQVLEMLGLYDEALVQYDELDALFSQFVVKGHMGNAAGWLSDFQVPLANWHGLRLAPSILPENPSLLELRSYLFSKQAHMLLLIFKPWEMASRCLPFLHTCVRELTLLEVTAPPGAVSCWLFLACLEILHTCDRFNDAGQVEAYSLYTAGLWAYASQKLRQLGELCGLLPGADVSWEQLHIVVELSAGMGDCPGAPGHPSPTDKLKEALRSKDAFNKHYLELSEFAMGTYKHISHLHSARLVGKELASFYKLLGETQKAAVFLGDVLKTFEQEGWRELAVQTQLELAECYSQAKDTRKYIRACTAVAAAPEMDTIVRCAYFDEMIKSLECLDKSLVVPFVNIFKIISVNLKCERIVMQDCDMEVELELESNFPKEVLCTNMLIALEDDKELKKCEDVFLRTISARDMKPQDHYLQQLKIHKKMEYRQDKQIAVAQVECQSIPLKRNDSIAKTPRSDFSTSLKAHILPLRLTPGLNVIRLKWLAQPGKYFLSQISVEVGHLEFLSSKLTPKLSFQVRREEPSITLDKKRFTDLLAGLEQILLLTITIGSYSIENGTLIKLSSTAGLTIQHDPNEELKSDLNVIVGELVPFSSTRLKLRVYAELPEKEHTITVQCPWMTKLLTVPLNFVMPLSATWHLHTSNKRKFIQITLTGNGTRDLSLTNVCLKTQAEVDFKNFNPVLEKQNMIITTGMNISYMWELLPFNVDKPIKTDFTVDYIALGEYDPIITDDTIRTFSYSFDIEDYETLYVMEAKVEPTKGNEFCRVGALCHLRLSIKQTSENEDTAKSLMYEVSVKQNVWAVCGRTAGVISLEFECGPQSVTLDVMPLTSGYLPLPLIRLSKYILPEKTISEGSRKSDSANSHPRLEPFSVGQVYNSSKSKQVHVLAALNEIHS